MRSRFRPDGAGEGYTAVSRIWLTGYRKRTMRWETPQAIDFRFGMEITMYIANR